MEQLNLREKILGRWARWSVENWGKALLIVLGLTIAIGYGMTRLRMEMTFYSILPDKSNQVKDLKRIIEEFPSASGILVVVDGRSIQDTPEAERTVKNTIDGLIREYSKEEYEPYVSGTTGRMDMTLFKEHGLMLSKIEDLERLTKTYRDLNLVPLIKHINDDFEAEYSGNSDKLEEDESQAVGLFKGLGQLLQLINEAAQGRHVPKEDLQAALDAYMLGDEYIMSNDNKMGLLIVQPTFTINDLALLRTGVDTVEKGAKHIASQHGIKAGLTGLTVIGRDEMVSSEKGLAGSSIIAFVMILGLLIFVFRMFSVPFIAGIPLLTGILWAIGLSGYFLDRLNIMTAMYIVALLGLGIDYAIHLLSAYIQERDDGRNFKESIEKSLVKSGSGILTGALTTSAAFFTLTIAKTDIMRELGVVAGLGILSELLVMILLIPPLLSLREFQMMKRGKTEKKLFSKVQIKSDAAAGIGKLIIKAPVTITVIMILTIMAFSFKVKDISLQKNILEMEAKGLESVQLNDEMAKEFGMAPDGLSIISNDLEEVRVLTDRLEELSSVKSVESLSDFYVRDNEYIERGASIESFIAELNARSPLMAVNREELLEELYRLEANLIELGDMAFLGNMNRLVNTLGEVTGINMEGVKTKNTIFDSLFTTLDSPPENQDTKALESFQTMLFNTMNQRVRTMAGTGRVTLDMLPSNISDSMISKDGSSYLITINPTQSPWEGDFREVYTAQIESVTDKATGTILAGDQLTIMAEQDGLRAAIFALIVIFIIMIIDFRNIKLALLTMLPLLASFLTLFGFMGLMNIKFDFLNIIVVPLLIGIGIDDAVHINHRYLKEGNGKMDLVIARTGTALLLTTLTTIFGFASFIPSVMRAMRSTGIVLTLAMTIAFLYSVLLHPAILIIVHERWGWNLAPWRKK
jgi:predicted RND superfamily exporter protein